MRRTILFVGALLLVLSAVGQTAPAVTLTFDSPVPGTIQDVSCLGTGFTDRLPGTGASIPTCDLNLELGQGLLRITSTYADMGENRGLGEMEALGLFLPNDASKDFWVSALFRDIELVEGSDQLCLYVGTAYNENTRAGLHRSFPDRVSQYFLAHNNHADIGTDWTDPPSVGPQPPAEWDNGDDVRLTLTRTNSEWGLSWHNLTNGDQGSSPTFSYPWLDVADDLYVGVHYASPRSLSVETSYIDEFSAIPEPSTLVMWLGLGLPLAVVYAWRRRKRGA